MVVDLDAVLVHGCVYGRVGRKARSDQVRGNVACHLVHILHGKAAGIQSQAVGRSDNIRVRHALCIDGVVADAQCVRSKRACRQFPYSDGLGVDVVGNAIVSSLDLCYGRFGRRLNLNAVKNDSFRAGNGERAVARCLAHGRFVLALVGGIGRVKHVDEDKRSDTLVFKKSVHHLAKRIACPIFGISEVSFRFRDIVYEDRHIHVVCAALNGMYGGCPDTYNSALALVRHTVAYRVDLAIRAMQIFSHNLLSSLQ